ncbi:hypothetical protein K438DRAFT_2016023 [Mycena galopus ATCC 62051]|nr:hypothetical protein K438DRAFT_2016023 [Mycena galopus ATCC 62051]
MPSHIRVPRTLNPDTQLPDRLFVPQHPHATSILLRLPSSSSLLSRSNELIFGLFSMRSCTSFAFGAVLAAATLWPFARYRDSVINRQRTPSVRNARSPHGALLWAPKCDFPLAALAKYKIPVFKESEFISKPTGSAEASPKIPSDLLPTPDMAH